MGPESQERPADVDAAGHCEECTDCAKADGRVKDVKQCVISLTFLRIALAAERELQGAAGAAEGAAGAAEGPAGGSGFQGLRDQGLDQTGARK